MKGHSFGCLLSEVLWWLRTPQLVNDPTGCLWRTRTFENKHEEEGGVNWKLLPAGIGNQ
jgi:hypothetical protein